MSTIDTLAELAKVAEYVNDDDLTFAMGRVIKLISKPDIPSEILGIEIVRLQAISAKLEMLASYETNVGKTDRAKKNLLYSAVNAIDKVVNALKYLVRS
jgi:hypothetical protein